MNTCDERQSYEKYSDGLSGMFHSTFAAGGALPSRKRAVSWLNLSLYDAKSLCDRGGRCQTLGRFLGPLRSLFRSTGGVDRAWRRPCFSRALVALDRRDRLVVSFQANSSSGYDESLAFCSDRI